MQLTINEVQKIATLARLELSEQEKELYTAQLSAIFDYIDLLNEVDTSNVEETCQVTGLQDVFREDIARQSSAQEISSITSLFPESRGGLLQVRGVFDKKV